MKSAVSRKRPLAVSMCDRERVDSDPLYYAESGHSRLGTRRSSGGKRRADIVAKFMSSYLVELPPRFATAADFSAFASQLAKIMSAEKTFHPSDEVFDPHRYSAIRGATFCNTIDRTFSLWAIFY